jgi:hypothetical protein
MLTANIEMAVRHPLVWCGNMSEEQNNNDPPQSVYLFAFISSFVLLIITMFVWPVF